MSSVSRWGGRVGGDGTRLTYYRPQKVLGNTKYWVTGVTGIRSGTRKSDVPVIYTTSGPQVSPVIHPSFCNKQKIK